MLFAKMLVSILVSNWIYAEICYFFPPFDNFVRTVFTQMQIPTHDKWGPIMRSSGGKRLGHEVGGTLRSSGLSSVFPFNIFQDATLDAIYRGGVADWDPLFPEENEAGNEFFKMEPWHPRISAGEPFIEVDSVDDLIL